MSEQLEGTGIVTDAERLARGAVLQTGAQVVRLVGGSLVMALLARQLTLGEYGTYQLILSQLTYVMFLKASVMNAAVVGVANAGDDEDARGVVVSTGMVIYAAVGVISGLALGAVGLAVLPLLNIAPDLYGEAQLSVIGLALAVFLGWPAQIFDDALRGLQRFAAVSALEIGAMVAYLGGAVALVLTSAPLWALVTWTASIPLLQGLACVAALRHLGVRLNVRRANVRRGEMRRFGGISGLFVLGGVADLATYSIDRFLLSAIRSPRLVGLYEGPLQTQNMIRYLNGVMTSTVVPQATRYIADDDRARSRELFVKGIRYCYAAAMPFIVALIVIPVPLVVAFLGPKYDQLGPAVALFASWWLIGTNNGLVGTMLFTAGRLKRIVVAQWVAAIITVALTAALTGRYGIYGPIVGSMVGFGASTAILFPLALRTFDVRLGELARQAWLPAFSTGAGLAAVLALVRGPLGLDRPLAGVIALIVGAALFWAAYALLWFGPDERSLVRRTLGL